MMLLGDAFLQGVSLLRTTCGTPNYVAPEVYIRRAYFVLNFTIKKYIVYSWTHQCISFYYL